MSDRAVVSRTQLIAPDEELLYSTPVQCTLRDARRGVEAIFRDAQRALRHADPRTRSRTSAYVEASELAEETTRSSIGSGDVSGRSKRANVVPKETRSGDQDQSLMNA